LIYLNQTILKFQRDLIIFLDGFNDYFNTDPGFDQWRDYAYQERAYRFLAEPTVSAWAYYTGWWLFRKSHFFHLAGRAANNLAQMVRTLHRGERPHLDLDTAMANLRINAENNFVKMVERNGLILAHEDVQAVFALQPEIAFQQGKRFSPLEQRIYDEMKTYWAVNYIEFKNRARPVVLDYLKKASASSGATVVDLTDIYAGVEGDVYTDYCHLTPLGNQVLAERLGVEILPIIEKRLRRSDGRISRKDAEVVRTYGEIGASHESH
jgi:lysophospholipase L1-like esterase